jgi:hypothetical protein
LTEYCLGYSWPLVFPYKFNGRFFNLFNECHWDFDGNCIKHVDYFWEYKSYILEDLAPCLFNLMTFASFYIFDLKSIFSFLCFYFFFYPFTFSLFIFFKMKWVFCRQKIFVFFFNSLPLYVFLLENLTIYIQSSYWYVRDSLMPFCSLFSGYFILLIIFLFLSFFVIWWFSIWIFSFYLLCINYRLLLLPWGLHKTYNRLF